VFGAGTYPADTRQHKNAVAAERVRNVRSSGYGPAAASAGPAAAAMSAEEDDEVLGVFNAAPWVPTRRVSPNRSRAAAHGRDVGPSEPLFAFASVPATDAGLPHQEEEGAGAQRRSTWHADPRGNVGGARLDEPSFLSTTTTTTTSQQEPAHGARFFGRVLPGGAGGAGAGRSAGRGAGKR